MPFITAYCSIRDYCISSNGKTVYAKKDPQTIDNFLIDAYDSLQINYPKFYKMDALSKAGLVASEVMLKGRSLKDEYSPERIAVILSNASSSLDTDLKYDASTKKIPSPALFVYTLPNIVTGEICIRHGWKGENGFFIFEKFDAEFMVDYVEQVLHQGSQACLAGWVELMGEEHDVFLYLVENKKRENARVHTGVQLTELYQKVLWNNS